MTADKSLEFLLFSGDYEAIVARTSGPGRRVLGVPLVGALALSGRLDEAQSAFRALTKDAPEAEAVVQARFFVIAGLCHAGNVPRALRLVRASLADLARPPEQTRFWIWQGLALVRFFEGRFGRARAAARRALASAMEASFPYARVLALDLLAHVLLHTGKLHAGMRLLHQAADLAESLGYADNTITLRTSAVIYELQYLLTDVDLAIARAVEAVASPAVSYFTRRNGLVEIAQAWAMQGDGERAETALDDARRIALSGSDRRGKARWLVAQALLLALSRGAEPAREVLDEARRAAGEQATLLAEIGFVEAVFVGPSPWLRESLPAIARATGMARARLASARILEEALPPPIQVEDGLSRVLLRCWRTEPSERVALLLQTHLLGLIPWALGLAPGRRLILTDTALLTEQHGTVALRPAPSGPSRRVLLALRGGYRGRQDLAELVWGLARYNPTRHSAVINTAVSRLRLSLAEPSWVVTRDDGYHLAEGVELWCLPDGSGAPEPAEELTAPLPPPPEEVSLFAVLRSQGPCSSAEVARALGTSASSALRLLRRLVDEGRVTREGTGRATRYASPGNVR